MVRRQTDSPGANIAGGGGGGGNNNGGNNSNNQGGGGGGFVYVDDSSKAVYIGVEKGSDLETQGVRSDKLKGHLKGTFGKYPGYRAATTGPKYKVGYLNSDEFSKILRNKDPDIVEFYQQRLAAAGLLDSYSPGQFDKATRAAFKEIVTAANQTGKTWQESLQQIENEGGIVKAEDAEKERDPFQAVLADPVSLRETFQTAVQTIYGGDLPDAEVQAMVDAFRSQQMAKQQAAYNAEGMGGTVESTEMDPQAFATAQVKEKHPQQLNRVKFTDAFDSILDTFTGGGQ